MSIPAGWEACEVCDLLIPLAEEGLCVYCRREADLLPIHSMRPLYETHGAMEAPVSPLMKDGQWGRRWSPLIRREVSIGKVRRNTIIKKGHRDGRGIQEMYVKDSTLLDSKYLGVVNPWRH